MLFYDEEKVKNILLKEKAIFAKLQLQDCYKLLFQSVYGPGHFVKSEEHALNWLQEEIQIKDASLYPSPIYEIGYDNDYCRAYLQVILSGKVSLSAFFQAFLNSAKDQTLFNYQEWIEFWEKSTLTIGKYKILEKRELITQQAELLALINPKNYILSHSSIYRELYKPRYRVLKKTYLSP